MIFLFHCKRRQIHKNFCAKLSSSQKVVATDQDSKSIFLANCGDPALKASLGSTCPVSEMLKHQSSRIILFQELTDFSAEGSELK